MAKIYIIDAVFDLSGGPCVQELEHPLFQPPAMD